MRIIRCLCFFGLALGLSQCGWVPQERPPRLSSADFCTAAVTSIGEIQGKGEVSPMLGETVVLRGLVTQTDMGAGFYMEQPLADIDPGTSDGIYVHSEFLAAELSPGDEITLRGRVEEMGPQGRSLTAITLPESYRICLRNQPLPVQETGLPMNRDQREAIEAMRVHIQQDLIVTEVRNLVTRGRLGVSLMDRLYSPTEIALPGDDAVEIRRQNQMRRLDLIHRQAALYGADEKEKVQAARVGDQVFDLSGVMTQIDGRYEISLDDLAHFSLNKDDQAPAASQQLRIVNMNVENLFNGDGQGGGFPTPRGAQTYADYQQQRDRLALAFSRMKPHILALQELENDGFGEGSAADDLIQALNQVQDTDAWKLAIPSEPFPGSGPITVGMAYRSDRVQALGTARWLTGPLFHDLSRPPMGQWFKDKEHERIFFLVSVHLKSKGSCPDSGDNRNTGDGQACWAVARTQAAIALSDWANRQLHSPIDPLILIMGDFNSYRMEDPIREMKALGWVDMSEAHVDEGSRYSYVFRGETGTLDYGFASSSLAEFVDQVKYWHINSIAAIRPEPRHPWDVIRVSDHDPLIIDLDFSRASQSSE